MAAVLSGGGDEAQEYLMPAVIVQVIDGYQ